MVEDLTPKEIVKYARQRYASNMVSRALLYARHFTMASHNKPHINPQSIVINIQGHAGCGKTAIIKQFARDEDIEYIRIDVGGIVDIADIFGIARVNPETGFTEFSKPSWFPKPGTFGIINIDDMTRANPSVLQAIMPFVLERSFNNLVLPFGWTVVVTTNPDDGTYNVAQTDNAFDTRLVRLVYNRQEEIFLDQLDKQDVNDLLRNYWRMGIGREQLKLKYLSLIPPESNDRFRMIFNHLYNYLQFDREAMVLVSNNMFGEQWTQTFIAFLASDLPIDAAEVINNYRVPLQHEVKRQFNAGRNDLLRVTSERLIEKLRDMDAISKNNWKNVASFLIDLPDDLSGFTVKSLIDRTKPKGDLFRSELSQHAGVLAKTAELFQEVESAMRR